MIIVTGSKGFIGRNFLKAFEDTDDVIIPVDSDIIEWMVDGFKDWHKVDLVIHQGAISSTVEKDIDKIHYYNVHLTLKLFEKCIKYGIPVKYASSASVYGNLQGVFNPLNYYAISKLQIDYWVQDNIDEFSLIQGFRYFNVYGDRQPLRGQYAPVIGIFLRQLAAGEPLTIVGDGEQRRDFVNVKDVCRANIMAAISNPDDEAYGQVYNVGTGKNYSVNEIAKMFNTKTTNIPARPGEARISLANADKIYKTFAWKPEVVLENWIKERLNGK